ncbi:Asp/Glu/hydantoin racemase [Naematelia encephala]|uniref:Asp/Glu/hydantoin racemase n=1 Tax=Naematelia encephala TaxID=71784 RepID=A0A1Y2ASJ9_9TREE|nr:Asp/Glu/hydantoin racemase [Naematelia encephala]
MQAALPADLAALDFYTAPQDKVPAGIDGEADSVVSAGVCLGELRDNLSQWDGFIVACFSHHSLTGALRELTTAPVISILEAPLLLAASIGARVGILTTGNRWVPLLEHGIHTLHLDGLCKAGVVASGMSAEDLHNLPHKEVLDRLEKLAREELQEKRQADVIVLGCAGMTGLEDAIRKSCQKGMVVLDPVRCGLELCTSLLRMGVGTSKLGMYAPA